MRIGILALRAGVTASKIRFYEAKGLLPYAARRRSGYRDYDERAVADLKIIRHGQQLGYTLKEIASYLAVSVERRQALLMGCIDKRLGQVDGEITRLTGQRSSLMALRQRPSSVIR